MINKIWTKIVTGLLFGLWSVSTMAASQSQLQNIRIEHASGKTQLILQLKGSAAYKVFSLNSPTRIVVDLNKTQLNSGFNVNTLQDNLIGKVRKSIKSDGDLRIVFDIQGTIKPHSLSVHPNVGHSTELVIELQNVISPTQTASSLLKSKLPVSASSEKNTQLDETVIKNQIIAKESNDNIKMANTKNQLPLDVVSDERPGDSTRLSPAKASLNKKIDDNQQDQGRDDEADTNGKANIDVDGMSAKILSSAAMTKETGDDKDDSKISGRDVVVVIDPGHGGKDPGAAGPRGTAEKDVVLAIAKTLKKIIDAQPGMRAVLTRQDDYFISLRERLNIARKDKGDMFVAIHADAFSNPFSMGSSVFALSERGASSEAARWLAEKENYSELGGVKLEDKDNLLRSVLIDLSQNYTISTSLQLGSSLLNQLGKITKLHRGFVEQARFVVLKSPDIPSVLIETGFLSNPMEEAKLRDPDYQEVLASAIKNGIKNYFSQNPPSGTFFAAQRNATSRYITSKGDTLPAIAKRFAISVKALKKYNRLNNEILQAGQVIQIPSLSES